jgi:hypothetical protein
MFHAVAAHRGDSTPSEQLASENASTSAREKSQLIHFIFW